MSYWTPVRTSGRFRFWYSSHFRSGLLVLAGDHVRVCWVIRTELWPRRADIKGRSASGETYVQFV
jgi:cytochrome b561